MRLIQLNAWGGRLESQLLEFITNQNPDLICFQEIISISGGNGGFFTTLEKIQRNIKYEAFMSPVFTFNFMRRQASFGNAILSNTTFKKSVVVFTNLKHKNNFDFDGDDYNVRNLQHVVIEHGNKKLNILNHHGHHIPEHKNGDAETMRQMKQIGEYIDTLEGPIILCGDFNLSPKSESLEQINTRLVNLPVEFRLKTTRTELTHKKEICDYVFVSKEVQVKDFSDSGQVVSDHKALILEFDV